MPRDSLRPGSLRRATARVLPEIPSWSRLAAVALALSLGGLGGWLASSLQLPLAWMIGSMVATAAAAIAGAPIAMAAPLRTVMVAVLGVMLGSGFTPEILAGAGRWTVTLAAIVFYIAACAGLGTLYFRKLCGYDPVTAYFSATPGGLSIMTIVGIEMGGDGRIISLTHAIRIMVAVLSIPTAFQLLGLLDMASRPPAGPDLAGLGLPDYLILGAAGLAGYLGARLLRIPAASIVGPMLVSMALHLAGVTHAKPPADLIACAQVAIGTAIGARFAGTSLKLIASTLAQSFGVTVIVLGMTVLFAFSLHEITGLPAAPIVLAFSPGGLAEMGLTAIALGADAAFVAIHHIVRILVIVVFAPILFRLLSGRTPPPGRGGWS
ncbi:hypothetical protein SAMN06265365_10170 [Tistlia consotensis]|uniref:Ammonia monooxygenase n=1 Tax=Tistlia consotensis USBA 355 TaxID=560819 RepID=A0A1Y6B6S7_9PROT|nr:AbrB family transcriptional regulator [Tistlia consotensis]SME88208.1 hypothetical protein SAMN05428998_10170 [Tistlia consotensis USBA 355]SNR24656.1 hypothetical protein SAMN06265365_10170 [Tistlia consotensis]